MDNIIRFSVSLPENLLAELDNKIVSQGYSSRSELVRDLIREKMVEEKWEGGDEEAVGVLTIVYDHHQRELNQKMIDIQHNSHIHILCNTHVHINHHNCLETIILKGIPKEIEEIALSIGGLKGVKFSKLTRASSF
ncbi:Putative nickel-responsive regulator [Wolinella succinogenes]|uniref:nickel-responsive transcriptional regulator NikR n=1 Tax=Wolinella succinogenes TaxID=844 RepID=UPI000ED803BE|nr:nickel-responsive transcriptional regulator NikR [Wolinella succinogenes]NLU34928.1 nickel-responsive transcriptional regulator NikR [Wolinella succinogenes]VEG82013.1 Putative nickel-responsive regulator [Wolinella succinogenes]HCZ19418.1 nickel-responsive transcriptional regulator NikR [Helicobacter sp.]